MPVEHKPHSESDAEIVLAWIQRGYHAEGHHPNCTTRTDEGCDCYARASAPARAALRRLVEQLEAMREALTLIADHGHEIDDYVMPPKQARKIARAALNPAKERHDG